MKSLHSRLPLQVYRMEPLLIHSPKKPRPEIWYSTCYPQAQLGSVLQTTRNVPQVHIHISRRKEHGASSSARRMTRMVLNAAKCSQIADPESGATSRGDRCTEVICAMIDATYHMSQQARNGVAPESLMQELAQRFNQGRDVGVPEDVAWIGNWLKEYSKGAVALKHVSVPDYQEIVESIHRGHIAIGALSDYVNLQLVDGSHPYEWNDPHGLSHIVLIVGYDDETQAVVVHDPLRHASGQPADYSWESFQAAQFYVLSEVSGPFLLHSDQGEPTTIPVGWRDDGQILTAPNGVPVIGAFREWVLTHTWESQNWPLIAARYMPAIEWSYSSSGPGARQDFRTISLGQPTGQDVYQIWVGQDIVALAQQLSDCKAQIDQMQQKLDEVMQLPTSRSPVSPGDTSPPSSGIDQPPAADRPPASPVPDRQQPESDQSPSLGALPPASRPTPHSVHKAFPPHHVVSQRSAHSFDLFTLFQRARAYLPLTPTERAFLKSIQGAICTAIVVAASMVYQGLNHHLDWAALLHTALAAGATALLFTLNKYFTAHVDPALNDLVAHVETTIHLPTGSETPPAPGD